jgi:hypothetical protein
MANEILRVVQAGNETHIVCDQDFCAFNGEEIKETLLQSLERTGDETLSLTAATSIDLSGIQIAFSWKNLMTAQGRKGKVLLPDNESIKDLLMKTGLTQLF